MLGKDGILDDLKTPLNLPSDSPDQCMISGRDRDSFPVSSELTPVTLAYWPTNSNMSLCAVSAKHMMDTSRINYYTESLRRRRCEIGKNRFGSSRRMNWCSLLLSRAA